MSNFKAKQNNIGYQSNNQFTKTLKDVLHKMQKHYTKTITQNQVQNAGITSVIVDHRHQNEFNIPNELRADMQPRNADSRGSTGISSGMTINHVSNLYSCQKSIWKFGSKCDFDFEYDFLIEDLEPSPITEADEGQSYFTYPRRSSAFAGRSIGHPGRVRRVKRGLGKTRKRSSRKWDKMLTDDRFGTSNRCRFDCALNALETDFDCVK